MATDAQLARVPPLAYAGAVRTVEQAYARHRGRLWGLCYRMSGCAADADDWLQDVFERALAQAPADLERDLGGWLTRVAMNVCRDHLRRRKHAAYVGPWLPGPIETSELWSKLEGEPTPEAQYGRLESVSLAFLRALEALTPNQRAVVVLRDVCDLSVRETAEVLELEEGAVKALHYRARGALREHDGNLARPSEQSRRTLEAFLVHLALGNVEALSSLLVDDVAEYNDGAGEYVAARRPVVGLPKLMKFHRKIARPIVRILACSLNAQPAVLVEFAPRRPREPLRAAVWLDTNADGRVVRVLTQVADRKLSGLPWGRARPIDAVLLVRGFRSAWSTPAPAAWRRAAMRHALRAAGRALHARARAWRRRD